MLKIKDNVKLKQLKELGFKPSYGDYRYKFGTYDYHYTYDDSPIHGVMDCISTADACVYIELEKNRRITFTIDRNNKEMENKVLDIIYSLIKADLVEKVDDTTWNTELN